MQTITIDNSDDCKEKIRDLNYNSNKYEDSICMEISHYAYKIIISNNLNIDTIKLDIDKNSNFENVIVEPNNKIAYIFISITDTDIPCNTYKILADYIFKIIANCQELSSIIIEDNNIIKMLRFIIDKIKSENGKFNQYIKFFIRYLLRNLSDDENVLEYSTIYINFGAYLLDLLLTKKMSMDANLKIEIEVYIYDIIKYCVNNKNDFITCKNIYDVILESNIQNVIDGYDISKIVKLLDSKKYLLKSL